MTIEEIKRIGIVGAGTMGQGIAQVCALAGYEVWLMDLNTEIIEKGIRRIETSLQALSDKGKLSDTDKRKALERLKPMPRLDELKADLIIETASEKPEIKQGILKTLEQVNDESCLLTTNTSSIPITQLAIALQRPEHFAGLHFFNPAPVMKLMEVISGASTMDTVINTLRDFSEKLGKVPVVVKDSPGFIVNRVARHYYVEALKLLEENVADIRTIDGLMKSSGFKMGPFELMDLIGVDTNFDVTTSIYQAFHQEPRFRPNRIQQQKVNAGHLGRKSGRGFYDYPK